MRLRRSTPSLLLPLLLLTRVAAVPAQDLGAQAEIRRTTYGIPHIRAENFRAAGYALGWVQSEDHGERVAMGLARARGGMARHLGPESLDADFTAQVRLRRAQETYHQVDREMRDVYEGFAAGVNRYVELHRAELPAWMPSDFTGHEVHALAVEWVAPWSQGRFVERLDSLAKSGEGPSAGRPLRVGATADDGSNAWAFAPSRTRSGRAILLRNPHLSWDAGYYEAHLTIPGTIDFYGDFRIGSPIGIIGGFNARLGWSTTNNAADLDEIYALDADPARTDHYLFDGASIPLRREELRAEVRNGEGLATESRTLWTTPLGPVIHRGQGKIYVYSSPTQGEWRAPMQFLRMMRARTLDEWKAAMRIRGRGLSNFTYADADGNIFYVWNASLPILPHPSGGDTLAVPARRTEEIWTRVVPWDSLPQLLNPRGGYLHNENSSPHYTNLNQVLDPARYPPNHEQPSLSLRSQHALELVHGSRKLSLEEVVALKHSMRMLLADRVKDDLLAAIAGDPDPEVRRAADLLRAWDNTAAPESRGSALFESWWSRYAQLTGTRGVSAERDPAVFRAPWSPDAPTATPRGLAVPARAAEAFRWAMDDMKHEVGGWDLAWGDVFRIRHGSVDLPAGGCHGALGCFRALWFERDDDGKYRVSGGDGWVLAVEFTDPVRAYSVLAYGQSDRPDSPHHDDQTRMFAEGRMKRVAFTDEEIERQTIRRYRPGL